MHKHMHKQVQAFIFFSREKNVIHKICTLKKGIFHQGFQMAPEDI